MWLCFHPGWNLYMEVWRTSAVGILRTQLFSWVAQDVQIRTFHINWQILEVLTVKLVKEVGTSSTYSSENIT